MKGMAMRNLLFAAVALTTLGMTTASFAGGLTGGFGTTYLGSIDSMGTSGSSSDAMSGSQSASADDQIWGATVLPPSGSRGGYPARQSNGCPSPGDPQNTGASTGLNCFAG
jgi:hypothetical protein